MLIAELLYFLKDGLNRDGATAYFAGINDFNPRYSKGSSHI